MKRNKDIVLTGATGFIGPVLIKNLLSLDYSTGIIARVQRGSLNTFVGDNCKVFVVDSRRVDQGLAEAIDGVDVVVHLAARVHVMNDTAVDPLSSFRQVNVEWTKKLAELAVAAKVKRFVFVSSLHVNGSDSTQHPFHELDQPKPPSPYANSKYEAEQHLNELAKKADMEIVIIRPPLVYGPEVKANFLSLLKLTSLGLPLPVGSLNNKRSMISVNNLVDFIICCIKHPKAANETFLISDDQDVSTRELFAKLIKLFGKRPLLLPVPARLMYFLGSLLGKKDIVERLCAPLQVDITKAKTMLNWKPIQTLDDGLREAVEWYKKEHL